MRWSHNDLVILFMALSLGGVRPWEAARRYSEHMGRSKRAVDSAARRLLKNTE